MEGMADIGVIGLAVMGENLVLNMEDKGFQVACYNRTIERVDTFLAGRGKGKRLIGCHGLSELVSCLEPPRRILMMVRAGKPVDDTIQSLLPLLEPGDVLVDGGNSHYTDTVRRCAELAARGILFVGAGVSGGEEGALHGPSIMPGGDARAWPLLKPILQRIAARAEDGTPCCDWVGPDGAGHFVKMVHNGIEYGDMQLIAEAYDLMSRGLGMAPTDIQPVFAAWNRGPLDSYLVEITADILAVRDPETGDPLVDRILDAAGQKGTGKWTSQAGLDLGVAIPQIAEAVFARCLSAIPEERAAAAGLLSGPVGGFRGDEAERREILGRLESAVHAAKICSYAQGFSLLRAASAEYGWKLDFARIADLWRAGCIIRARFLGRIREAFGSRKDLPNLMLDPYFREVLAGAQGDWRAIVRLAADIGIPVPSMGTALTYYDGYRSGRLPANLVQAQRDYFGAHGYERTDKPRGTFFHTNWTGTGGDTASSQYQA